MWGHHISHHCCLFRPNSGFVEQLKLWEAMKCRIDTHCKYYWAYCKWEVRTNIIVVVVAVIVTVIQWILVHALTCTNTYHVLYLVWCEYMHSLHCVLLYILLLPFCVHYNILLVCFSFYMSWAWYDSFDFIYLPCYVCFDSTETGYVDSLCMSPDFSSQQVHGPPDSPGGPVSYQCKRCRCVYERERECVGWCMNVLFLTLQHTCTCISHATGGYCSQLTMSYSMN